MVGPDAVVGWDGVVGGDEVVGLDGVVGGDEVVGLDGAVGGDEVVGSDELVAPDGVVGPDEVAGAAAGPDELGAGDDFRRANDLAGVGWPDGSGAPRGVAGVDDGGCAGVRDTRTGRLPAGASVTGVDAGGSAGKRATFAGSAGGGSCSSPSRILAPRPTSGAPRFIRATRFSSGVGGATPAPPMNGVPAASAASASPNSHSAPQSDIPGAIVLSVGDATHSSAAGAAGAGAGAAERASVSRFGTSRIAARTGSGRSCRPATARPSRSPLPRATTAWRPSRRRPMRGLGCREVLSSIARQRS